MHKKYYIENKKYSQFLETQKLSDFEKYIFYIKKHTMRDASFLDVGCGTGIVLENIKKSGIKGQGVEISSSSIKICKKKKLSCKLYGGERLPYKSNTFNSVGSFNVLEHTDNPKNFLKEKLRVLKKKGFLIIVCPNFLSITNSYHHHTQGFIQKILNFYDLIRKTNSRSYSFKKMDVINRLDFKPDDDACIVTNPLDIKKWGEVNKLKLIYWSSQQNYNRGFVSILDKGIMKYILGSCFFIFQKV